jgi:pentatricopeptide repeat protein
LISACEKGKDLLRALQLYNDLQHRGIMPDIITYNALISTCEKGQDLPKALQLWDSFQHQGIKPDIFTYSA